MNFIKHSPKILAREKKATTTTATTTTFNTILNSIFLQCSVNWIRCTRNTSPQQSHFIHNGNTLHECWAQFLNVSNRQPTYCMHSPTLLTQWNSSRDIKQAALLLTWPLYTQTQSIFETDIKQSHTTQTAAVKYLTLANNRITVQYLTQTLSRESQTVPV